VHDDHTAGESYGPEHPECQWANVSVQPAALPQSPYRDCQRAEHERQEDCILPEKAQANGGERAHDDRGASAAECGKDRAEHTGTVSVLRSGPTHPGL